MLAADRDRRNPVAGSARGLFRQQPSPSQGQCQTRCPRLDGGLDNRNAPPGKEIHVGGTDVHRRLAAAEAVVVLSAAVRRRTADRRSRRPGGSRTVEARGRMLDRWTAAGGECIRIGVAMGEAPIRWTRQHERRDRITRIASSMPARKPPVARRDGPLRDGTGRPVFDNAPRRVEITRSTRRRRSPAPPTGDSP